MKILGVSRAVWNFLNVCVELIYVRMLLIYIS
jgi:hypothetical protein